MNLKLEGEKVSGTFETEHTGKGTISKGWCKNNKLDITVEFAKHETIIFKGELKNGKITGEYSTEGRTGMWEAKRN